LTGTNGRASILFELAHPKHYLQFRQPMRLLAGDFDVQIAARDKDVLLRLLEEHGERFATFTPNLPGLRRKVLGIPRVLTDYASVLRRFRPDLIVSRSSPYAAVLGRFFGARTVVCLDSEGVALNEKVVAPLSSYVISSGSYESDYGAKHHRVSGLFETGYLHPAYFTPGADILEAIGVAPGERFALFRFVSWSANHDIGKRGIGDAEKVALTRAIGGRMKVFISGESALPEELEFLRLRIPASRMHDVLAFASLYVGDSQTMATEAALLGTPAVRCNSFAGAGDFSNFRNLELKHDLLRSYAEFADALRRAEELADDLHAKSDWLTRRAGYFDEAGDVNAETASLLRTFLASGRPPAPQPARARAPIA
jgi:uncharacterized protein